jgi:hypothetical protein
VCCNQNDYSARSHHHPDLEGELTDTNVVPTIGSYTTYALALSEPPNYLCKRISQAQFRQLVRRKTGKREKPTAFLA